MPRYEFSEGTSNKFWEIELKDTSFTTTYGKIGAAGQTTLKSYGDAATAKKEYDKLIAEKTKKGYVLVGGSAPAAAAKPAPAPKAAPAAKLALVPAPAAAPAPAASTGDDGKARYEFVEGGSSKFWEIALEETSVVTTYGRIGTEGQSTTKEFDDEGEAQEAYDKLVAEKTKKGYRLVSGGPAGVAAAGSGNPELEAAIAKDPASADNYLVYADWLQSQNDPRGELIVLHQRAETDKAMNAKAKAFLEKNKKAFLGTFAEETPEEFELEWRLGFIRKAVIAWPAFEDDGVDSRTAARQFKQFLELTSAKFIEELELGPVPGEDMMNLGGLTEAIDKKKLPTLRKLYLGHIGDWDISGTETDMPECAAIANLQSLTLRGGHIGLPKQIDLPELREFTVETGGLDKASLKAIVNAKWPKLEKLSIWFGDKNYGAEGTLKDIQPILDGRGLPNLKHLGIMNCGFVNEAVEALIDSKLLPQLTSLDLSMGNLSDATVEKMVAAKDQFAHLQLLDVSDSALTDAGIQGVKKLAKKVEHKEQEPERATEDAYRFVSVGE
ncbi:MAG: WGR domain-containing protein [Myxococcales bacterium]